MTWNTNTSILARLETFSDDTAWTSLVDHFERPLTRYAQRTGLSPAVARDVVQETLIAFAQAYRGGNYDRSRGRLSGWLFGIARREVAGARRRLALDRLQPAESSFVNDTPETEDALERIWEEEWRGAILERCVERVRQEVEPATWQCFALQAFEGLSADEVVKRLGLPRTRVYNAKHRISRRLRELAREYEDA
ncbi:MAG: sigma-70 family RNA polymerase sigma factor [bacterium]|nr:sigma-70 family RNA polymerase sigma factor [bacterium]